MTDILQASLTGGELAPALHARVDLERYSTSLKLCRNWQVNPYGGIFKRNGTKYVCTSKTKGDQIRLLPFSFSTDQSYTLEFGDEYVRFIKEGAQITYSNRTAWAAGCDYAVGDYVKSGTTAYRCITAHTSVGSFSAGSNWKALGTIGAVAEIVSPWDKNDLALLKITQANDIMAVTHPDYPPYEVRRYDHDDWEVVERSIAGGPFQELNTDETITIASSSSSGTVTLTSTSNIFTVDNIGKYLYMEIGNYGSSWDVGKTVIRGQVLRYASKYYRAVDSGVTGTIPPTHFSGVADDGKMRWEYLHEGSGICKITSVGTTTATATVIETLPIGGVTSAIYRSDNDFYFTPGEVINPGMTPTFDVKTVFDSDHGLNDGDTVKVCFTFIFAGYTRDFEAVFTVKYIDSKTVEFVNWVWDVHNSRERIVGDPKIEILRSEGVNPTHKWAWQEWDETRGYPSCATYFQQRLVFAGTDYGPQTVWASRTDDFVHFLPSGLQVYDDDALAIPMALSGFYGAQTNRIRHLIPLDRLLTLSSAGAASIGNTLHEPLTPDNHPVEHVSFYGASELQPLGIGDSILYQQDKGRGLRDLTYNDASMRYGGQDLTVMASHLFEGHTITEWCYQDVPNKTVWCVRDDGVLLGMTYLKEQQVIAWHQHDLTGLVESVCCVSEDTENALYLSVNRSGVRHINRLTLPETSAIGDQFYVDSGMTFASAYPETDFTIAHLPSTEIAVLADGVEITGITTDSSGNFSIPSENAAVLVQAGLPIQSDGETLSPVLSLNGESTMSKKKVIPSVTFMVKDSSSFKAGPDSSELVDIFDQTAGTLETGLFDVSVSSQWKQNGTVYFRHTSPLPCFIQAIIPNISIGG